MQIGLGLWLGTRQVGGFDPAAVLFGAGEQGGWYDSSDLSTMFQDTAGTVPVTAAGQTVGLVLDKSQGLALGPELVTNGDFNDGLTGWTSGGAITSSIVSGESQITFAGSAALSSANWFSQANALTDANKFYRVAFDATWVSGGVLQVSSGFDIQRTITAVDTNKTTYITYVRRGTIGSIANQQTLVFAGAAGAVWKIDNISVKELAGNHLTQATAADRPAYGIEPFGGRRNLMTWTEQFDNAAWSKPQATATANTTTAPDGTMTADTLVDTAVSNIHYTNQASGSALSPGATVVMSVYAKASTLNFVTVGISDISSGSLYAVAVFNLSSGTLATSGAAGTGYAVTATSITSVGNGWYRCTATCTVGTSASFLRGVVGLNKTGVITGAAGGMESYLGNGSGIFLWGAQLETGSLATPYQCVTDEFNVTEAGVPSVSYLTFIANKWFISPTITPGIDKAQVFAGVRKLSDAAAGALIESSASTANNPGVVGIFAPGGAAANYSYRSQGSAVGNISTTPSTFTSPITNVLTGIGDIAGDVATLRVNGVQAATSATDQGTGNYLAYPLYVGRRGGTSLPFNGRLYQLLVRFGANLDASTIAATEAFVNSKTGAYV